MQSPYLTVSLPSSRSLALQWVSRIVFEDMLGLPIQVAETATSEVVLSVDGRSLFMPSAFPVIDDDGLHLELSVPKSPLATLDPAVVPDANIDEPLPVLFGRPEVDRSERDIRCGIDILGSIFFMLSRFEEVALPHRDAHDRFPATASLAWQNGFLYRPIVDEYVELLWALMKSLWPGLSRRRRTGDVNASCDVDQPFDNVGRDPIMLARVLRHEIFVKNRPGMAARRAANFVTQPFGSRRFDPFYTFDWYMDACERHSRRAAFYFIADHSHPTMDGTYEIDDPRILALIGDLSARGHEIGMHGSYNTFRDGRQISRERERLRDASEKAGAAGDLEGNRQHYLRWDASVTPDLLDAAGFEYDATGSFADRPGFRFGTSHPFPMWSWQTLRPLRLKQKPLVLMEGSVISEQYLGLGHSDDAWSLMQTLKARALRYGGDFNLLWHNSDFFHRDDRNLFEAMLS